MAWARAVAAAASSHAADQAVPLTAGKTIAGVAPCSFTGLDKRISELQEEVDDLGFRWSQGLNAMQEAYDKQDGAGEALNASWQASLSKLETFCLRLRTTLEQLAEDKALCSEAQSDETSGLPALFKKSRSEPERFKSWGPIQGCATGATELSTGSCACKSGTAALGCKNPRDPSEKELLCTRLLQKTVPGMKALRFFQQGGACEVDGSEGILAPVLGDDHSDSPSVQQAMMNPLPLSIAARLAPPTLNHAPFGQGSERGKTSRPQHDGPGCAVWRGPQRGGVFI